MRFQGDNDSHRKKRTCLGGYKFAVLALLVPLQCCGLDSIVWAMLRSVWRGSGERQEAVVAVIAGRHPKQK